VKRIERREGGRRSYGCLPEREEHRGLVTGGQPPVRRIAREGRESLERARSQRA
jgi:hypothetical protein